MTAPDPLPPHGRPERLSILAAVLLVAIGDFAAAVLAALLVVVCLR